MDIRTIHYNRGSIWKNKKFTIFRIIPHVGYKARIRAEILQT